MTHKLLSLCCRTHRPTRSVFQPGIILMVCGILLGFASTTTHAQTLFLDPVGIGANVTLTGVGAPASSSVELFKNGTSVGSFPTTAYGLFSIPNLGAAANDLFYVTASQVWHFNVNGNSESWNALSGDASVVGGGTWRTTNSVGTDMSLNIYGNGLIQNRARVLEVRLRYLGSGPRTPTILRPRR